MIIKNYLDKNYIEHQRTSLNNAQSRTFPILSFTITINLAFLGALYILSCETGKYISVFDEYNIGLKWFITCIMLVLNACFTLAYFRELLMNRILRKIYYKGLIGTHSTFGKIIYKSIADNDWIKFTGKIFEFIFSFILSINFIFCLLLTRIYFNPYFKKIFFDKLYNCCVFIHDWFAFIFICLILARVIFAIIDPIIENKSEKALKYFKSKIKARKKTRKSVELKKEGKNKST